MNRHMLIRKRKLMKIMRKSAATACAKQVTIFAVLTALVAPVPAFADLMLFPTRVVMENGVRSAQVELVNRDTTPASYKINLINRRMTETGEIVEAEDARPDEAFADKMVFFTPRLGRCNPDQVRSSGLRCVVRPDWQAASTAPTCNSIVCQRSTHPTSSNCGRIARAKPQLSGLRR